MTRSRKILTAVAATAALALAGATTASAHDGNVVRVRDNCDAATFNAALGEGVCASGHDGLAFEKAEAKLRSKGSLWAWRFGPRHTSIHEGETLVARFAEGGEAHTFTEVAQFGAGCVQGINDLAGIKGAPAASCSRIEADYIGPQRTELAIGGLAAGEHNFQCLIHPWMRTTVEVR
jgi:hypothetical protein